MGTWYVHEKPDSRRQRQIHCDRRYCTVLYYFDQKLFSLVRRIKSGAFVDNALLYMIGSWINRGLNHLPKALKWIIIFLFLVALNEDLYSA